MGGICSRRSTIDRSIGGTFARSNGHGLLNDPDGIGFHPGVSLPKTLNNAPSPMMMGMENQLRDPFAFSDTPEYDNSHEEEPKEPQLSRAQSQKSKSLGPVAAAKIGATKVSEVSSLLGRAGTVGLGKAVEVLDTLGSSMTNLNLNSGFASGATSKGSKIAILSFEVANTIVKGANLMQSLSKENIRYLKEVVLPSEGVKRLISSDTNELLRIAASDKREELSIFAGEVVRFGNRCKDPQWHNLDRYFEKLGLELTPQKQLKEEAESIMQQLMGLVQCTAELYHELHALDRFDQDYRRKLQEEENPTAAQRGDSISMLRAELKSQNKHVRSLKKKSLWSKILEEVMEKLVDIVHFLHLEIHEAFGGDGGLKLEKKAASSNQQRLGSAGLALHYANIITQIDTLVSRPSSIPPNARDTLYQGLPPSVKLALRSKLLTFTVSEELTIPQIKAEMEKTLQWLVPIAANTTKAHHGFGWVGEWANTGSEVNRKPAGADLTRIETLHHADKEKTEAYMLELVVWLHHLVSRARPGLSYARSPIKSPIRSPNQLHAASLSSTEKSAKSSGLSEEDQNMLRRVTWRKFTPGISKSQEFDIVKPRSSKYHRLSKSSSQSPSSWGRKDSFPLRRLSMLPVIDFDIDKLKALDVIDRVDTIRSI
ncbi:protein PSK SIMULATOR 1 [Nymphaea colorata]|uniref:protein PSK SIMULATOR 1 n=1 Tax=Nymphaea colorata TaxID=210225 RepID=UPI00129E48B9|nr:protein PSK SIMULATOR 1 [Nymphaea colorata]XP_031487436.1 protein PSK SIMULATOR 1 [Nymphaea colorata]